ncbi:MAG: molybdopterin-binding protein, partial [Gemmatimonadales bacterium]
MELELITIGDELLLGHTLDTNSVQLSKAFGTIGVRVVRRTTVTDSAAEIAGAVAEAMSRSDMVVTTGG